MMRKAKGVVNVCDSLIRLMVANDSISELIIYHTTIWL